MKRTKELIEENKDLQTTLHEMQVYKEFLESELKQIKQFQNDNLDKIEWQSYNGYEYKVVTGGKTYDFKNISDWVEADLNKKKIEKDAKLAFDIYQSTGQRPITEDGELIPLPEINYRKSYLRVTKIK